MKIHDLRLVDLRERFIDGRPLRKESIPILMESIREVGILSPLRVRPIMVSAGPTEKVQGWEITSGRHRFNAATRLRMNEGDMRFDSVPCIVVENEDDLHRDLAVIDENLCRADLYPSEMARAMARRKEIFEELHPETKHGGAPGKAGGGKKAKDPKLGSSPAFINATAKATGKSRTTVSRDAQRGEKISPKALDAVSGTALDKGTYLDKLKVVPVEEQVSKVEHDLAAKTEPATAPAPQGRPRRSNQELTIRQIWAVDGCGNRRLFDTEEEAREFVNARSMA